MLFLPQNCAERGKRPGSAAAGSRMGTLDALVAQITALSGEADLPQLLNQLKSNAQDNVMRQSAGGLLAAVAGLDAAAHSLGCLHLL